MIEVGFNVGRVCPFVLWYCIILLILLWKINVFYKNYFRKIFNWNQNFFLPYLFTSAKSLINVIVASMNSSMLHRQATIVPRFVEFRCSDCREVGKWYVITGSEENRSLVSLGVLDAIKDNQDLLAKGTPRGISHGRKRKAFAELHRTWSPCYTIRKLVW